MTNPNGRRGSAAGFSLVELLVAASVLGVLAALALPSGQEALARMRVEAAGRYLMVAIDRERDRALRQGWQRLLPLEGSDGLLAATEARHLGVTVQHTMPEALRFTANGLLIDGGTVVLSNPHTSLRRCLVVSLPLGVMRFGRHDGAAPSSSDCKPDPFL